MIDARFLPLVRPDGLKYARSAFKRNGGFYSRGLDLLERELRHLRAAEITIQAGFRLEDIRNDGWPRSNAKPSHPGVIVQFRRGSSPEPFTFKALRYGTYEENIYAIAMSLEALRAVDRYGVVEGQQYAGFKQLAAAPPPDDRQAKLRNMAENGATEGERAAARAALERLKAGAA